MSKGSTTKEKILSLRCENKSYNQIAKLLGLSKATISYHCKNLGVNDPVKGRKELNKKEILDINEYYLTHTIEETANHFDVSRSTVVKHCKNKSPEKLSDEERKRRNYLKVKNRRNKLKKLAIEYKGGSCSRCGYDKSSWALEFHHCDPNKKDFAIGKYSKLAWEKIKKELDKCILVCANCHREIHEELDLNK